MKLKRTAAAVVAAVMTFTAVATRWATISLRLKERFPQVRITALRIAFILLH